MRQGMNLRVLVTLLAVGMALLILFGGFSLTGSGFSLGYSYRDVFLNTDGTYKMEGVWRLRLAGGVMVLAAILVWLKGAWASLVAGIATGGFFLYDTIRRLMSASKYGFFEGAVDFFIFILPVFACIFCILLFRKIKQE